MKRIAVGLVACLACHVFASPLSQKATVESARWLAGCWEADVRGKQINEQWMGPAGGTMLGMSRTVSRNKVTAYEFLQIRDQDDGNVHYVARPSGQAEAAFKLIKAGVDELIFENPDHDFPQRIIYRRDGEDTLTARIEGKNNGKEMGFDYPFTRGKCQ